MNMGRERNRDIHMRGTDQMERAFWDLCVEELWTHNEETRRRAGRHAGCTQVRGRVKSLPDLFLHSMS